MTKLFVAILLFTLTSCTDSWLVAYNGPVDKAPLLYLYNQTVMNTMNRSQPKTTRFLEISNPRLDDMLVDVYCTSGAFTDVMIPARTTVFILMSDNAITCSINYDKY